MQLKPHQIQAIERIICTDGVQALHHKVGTGKTFTGLSAFRYYRDKNPNLKLLVICPLNLIEGAWIKEIEKIRAENGWSFNWMNLNQNKIADHRSAIDIYIVNYEYMMSDQKFKKLTDLLSMGEWMAFLDESSEFKNHKSKTADRILGWWENKKFNPGIKNFCKYRITGSGTPAPNIEWEFWSQMKFLNDDILGADFFKFRNKHFQLKRGNQIAPGAFLNRSQLAELQRTGFKYEIIPEMRDKMLNRMKPYCHVVDSLDGMPQEIDHYTIVDMSPEQLKVYRQMKSEYIAEVKRDIAGVENTSYAVANVALTKFLRLRQITSGFVRNDAGEDIGFLKTNPKIEALKKRIEWCGRDQIIIWVQFHWEIRELDKVLLEIGGGASNLHGLIKPSDRINHINDFESGKNRFLIAHPDSAQFGLTFVNCHYQEFFSLNYSSLAYDQCRGRIARHGQNHPCVYNHIICRGTIDEDMLAVIQGKTTTSDIVQRYLKD